MASEIPSPRAAWIVAASAMPEALPVRPDGIALGPLAAMIARAAASDTSATSGTAAASAASGTASASASGAASVASAWSDRRPVVLVDGRSGTGKTTLANALVPALAALGLDAQLVHLDDVYPGWDGLGAASDAVVDDMLVPPDGTTGRPGWRRWDWGTSLPAEWRPIDAARPLVVEGCGALSRRSAPSATLRVWIDGDDATRRTRALARDGAVFAREWDRWAEQEEAFLAAEDPRAFADVVLRAV